MTTQLKHTDFQPIPFPAARPNLRVVFDTTSATSAVTAALNELPPAVRNATLDELAIGSAAEALVATARHLLSPHVYNAFLIWGATTARFSGEYEMEDEGDKLVVRTRTALDKVARAIPLNVHDLAFKTYLLALEASDGPVFGPLYVHDGHVDFVNLLARGVAPDLDGTSPVIVAINSLARQARSASPKAAVWSDGISAAIVQAFEVAQQMPVALPSSEMFARCDVERIPSRFHHGLLVQWDKAYAAYQEAVATSAATDGEDDPDNLAGAAESYAYHRLLLLPAPSPAALAIKARVYEEACAWELNAAVDIARVFASDTRRFARMGPFLDADKPVLEAFETYRRELVAFYALPDDCSNADEDAAYARMDPASMALVSAKATTLEGVISKLRYGFQAIDNDRWVADVILNPGSELFRRGVEMDGLPERILWSAIEDLARIAGVSLTEKAA